MAFDAGKRKRSPELDESDDDIGPISAKRMATGDEDSTWTISQQMKRLFQWMPDTSTLNRFIDSTLYAIGLRHSEPHLEEGEPDQNSNDEEEENISFSMRDRRGKLSGIRDYEYFPIKHKSLFLTSERSQMIHRNVDEVSFHNRQKKFGRNRKPSERILFSSLPNRLSRNAQDSAKNYDFVYSHRPVGLNDKFSDSVLDKTRSPFYSSISKQREKGHLSSTPLQERTKFRTLPQVQTDRPSIKSASIFKSSKESTHKQVTSLPKKNFTTHEIVRVQEKEQYRMLLEQFSQNHLFCFSTRENLISTLNKQITDPDLNKDPCSGKADKPKQVNENDGISKTKSVSNVLNRLVEDDEPLVLEVKPRTPRLHTREMQNSRLYSSDWIQELKKLMIEKAQETRKIAEAKEHQIKKYEENRARKLAKLRKHLLERKAFSLKGDLLEIVTLEKESILPELTPEMNKVIDDALKQKPPNEVVSRYSNLTVLYKDIDTLSGLNWLNDEIINTYMFLIKERSKLPDYPSVYVFNSFFYPKLKAQGHSAVKRWTRKEDVFSYDINLVPLHLGVHWCLAVIDHRYKKIQYYDSMNGKENCLPILKQYLMAESKDKRQKEFDTTGWTLEIVKNIPPQLNGSDCGMFTLKYAEYITRNAEINFNQQHMQYFRRKMVYEIITGHIV